MVKLGEDPRDIAGTVAVGVSEAPGICLVHSAALPPSGGAHALERNFSSGN